MNKPFLYYEDLLIVFGKYRMIEEDAEDPTDTCESIEKKEEALGNTMSLRDDKDIERETPSFRCNRFVSIYLPTYRSWYWYCNNQQEERGLTKQKEKA